MLSKSESFMPETSEDQLIQELNERYDRLFFLHESISKGIHQPIDDLPVVAETILTVVSIRSIDSALKHNLLKVWSYYFLHPDNHSAVINLPNLADYLNKLLSGDSISKDLAESIISILNVQVASHNYIEALASNSALIELLSNRFLNDLSVGRTLKERAALLLFNLVLATGPYIAAQAEDFSKLLSILFLSPYLSTQDKETAVSFLYRLTHQNETHIQLNSELCTVLLTLITNLLIGINDRSKIEVCLILFKPQASVDDTELLSALEVAYQSLSKLYLFDDLSSCFKPIIHSNLYQEQRANLEKCHYLIRSSVSFIWTYFSKFPHKITEQIPLLAQILLVFEEGRSENFKRDLKKHYKLFFDKTERSLLVEASNQEKDNQIRNMFYGKTFSKGVFSSLIKLMNISDQHEETKRAKIAAIYTLKALCEYDIVVSDAIIQPTPSHGLKRKQECPVIPENNHTLFRIKQRPSEPSSNSKLNIAYFPEHALAGVPVHISNQLLQELELRDLSFDEALRKKLFKISTPPDTQEENEDYSTTRRP